MIKIMKDKELICILFLNFILLFPNAKLAQNSIIPEKSKTTWSIITEKWSYCSFSLQKNSLPLSLGYPVIKSELFAFGISYNIYKAKANHHIKLILSIPSSLDSDNGRGGNYILQKNKSKYFRSEIDYRLSFSLLSWKGLKARHSFLCGLLYENRKAIYLSGAAEKTEDINFYIGPGLQFEYNIADNWIIEATFDGHFYLPFINYGMLTSTDSKGMIIFTSSYRALYYQTIFKAGIACRLSEQSEVEIGIQKNNLIGFANREPLFYLKDIVHFKLDRLIECFLKYSI